MKRVISLLVAVCLSIIACGSAVAEMNSDALLEIGQIVRILPNTEVDLNADGSSETITFEILKDEEGYDVGFRLGVGDVSAEGEGWSLNDELYALRLDQYNTLLLVSDYGPSDDYETFFYQYTEDGLRYAGSIYALPESMTVSDGIITAPVRGNLLYTWFHDADFGLAEYWGEDGKTDARIYPIPRYLYPMGLMVKLKVDLPLCVSMTDHEIACTLKSGSMVILCAADDQRWVYIEAADESGAGWMKAGGKYGMECFVGDEPMFSWDVFDGLLFAD